MSVQQAPVVGFVAHSGTGKTTLLCKLIPMLKSRGIRVGVIKHAHHNFDIDHPGKDSYKLREAGAGQMLIGSAKRWALVNENLGAEPNMSELLARLDHSALDLILIEGFKSEAYPKIECFRPSMNKALLAPRFDDVIAIACDDSIDEQLNALDKPHPSLSLLDLNDVSQICDFVMDLAGLTTSLKAY